MFQTKVTEKIKTRILSENLAVYEIVWKKYGRARQATDGNMAHAHFMLENLGYTYILGICNNFRFSKATMVKRFNVTFICTLPVLLNNSFTR